MKMSSPILDNVINSLDFARGTLLDASKNPTKQNKTHWLDKGDWLKASAQAGVSRIFFVENNPMVVFAQCGASQKEKIETYNKIWCLSGPRILFLESEGELSVIDLAQKPVRVPQNGQDRKLSNLETLTSVKNILQKLQAFHRDNIESGKVFQDSRFQSIQQRADQALISNLRIVRKRLIDDGLSKSYAHSLIGRSIFIRYLEDRRILTDEYFIKVAKKNTAWENLVINPAPEEETDFSNMNSKYSRVLHDKNFTYELFRTLARDFNGDMFPDVANEEKNVKPKHLKILRGLLYGNTEPALFFYSYRFDIIPLALISAIYEEFYRSTNSQKTQKKTKARYEGAFYTPPALAEFVLARTLNKDIISKKPRILDPACGSGIFLVESFRRIVRYHYSKGKFLEFDDLVKIIGEQLVGIEINEEAARITAFSLYLALLNYLEPPSILEHIGRGERLPNLLANNKKGKNCFNNIFVENAFLLNKEVLGKIDIVVGNPPWGAPGNNAPPEVKEQIRIMLNWCKCNGYIIGDQEPSQAFLLFAKSVLVNSGHCSMLVSHNVLLSIKKKSVFFRRKLFENIDLVEVYNFSHVRNLFFNGAVSPFFFVHFTKKSVNNSSVVYWSPKQIRSIENTQSVILTKYDRNIIHNQDLTNNKTWKVNWFGRYADSVFIFQLENLKKLISIIDEKDSGRGYQICSGQKPFTEIRNLKSLSIPGFRKYTELEHDKTPEKGTHQGKLAVYYGPRLLVKKGISTKSDDLIIARYETDDFCFSNSIHGLKLAEENNELYLLMLGILWSSFSKYYFFNTTAHWGIWHDEIYLYELFELPLPEELSGNIADHVIALVKQLRNYKPDTIDILHPSGVSEEKAHAQRRKWEHELDEAVIDLYHFTEHQRCLIHDCCDIAIPFFYEPYNSVGNKPVIENGNTDWIKNYAACFADYWQPYLEKTEALRADTCIALSDNIIVLEFYIAEAGDVWDLVPKEKLWQSILTQIEDALPTPIGTSTILVDGIVQIVTDDSIIIIKRNEKRFWTKSIAYEDAESAMTKRILDNTTKTRSAK